MLKIRLQRVGKRKRPSYRIVVADSRTARNGLTVEIIGHYDPLPDPPALTIKGDRALWWLQHGAQPSEAAAKLLVRQEIVARPAQAN